MSEGGKVGRQSVEDGVEDGAVTVGEDELLLEDFRWVFDKEGRKKRCTKSVNTREKKPTEQTRWFKRSMWKVTHCFVE